MVHHTDPKLIELLRSQHRDGRTSADLLRLLDDRGLDMVESMDHFRIAFGLDSYDVAPIGGWFADGTGELTDAAVSDLLDRSIARRSVADGARATVFAPMEGDDMDRLTVRMEVPDALMAQELRDQLTAEGAEVTSPPTKDLVPLLPIVIAVVVGVSGLASTVMRVIHGRGCQVLIDARSAEITKKVDCSVRDGRLIVITKDGDQVEIVDVPDPVDLTALVTAAVSGTAAAVKDAATAIGATVTSGD